MEEATVVKELLEAARFLERKLLEDLQGIGADVEKITVHRDYIIAMLHLLNGFSDVTKTLLVETKMLRVKLAEKKRMPTYTRR